MKTRIEILVDAHVPEHRIEEFRKSMEDAVWSMTSTWHNIASHVQVQANEVAEA